MTCYLCSNHMELLFIKNGYEIFECTTCGLGMTNFQRNYKDFVRDNYSKGYFTGDPTKSAYVNYKDDKKYITKNLEKYLNNIKKIKPNGALLDAGCALGFFVELALSQGYDAFGFDPSEHAVSEARLLVGDNRIKEGTIDSVKYKKKSFDIITMFDVFEHLGDPQKDVDRLTSLLKDDGIIVIATGNTKSVAARVLKRRWTFYIPPQHLFFFNKSNLITLLSQAGLIPIRWFWIGKWLSMKYILHLARTTGESKLGQYFYKLIKDTPLARVPLYIPMGDNIVVIAQKVSPLI